MVSTTKHRSDQPSIRGKQKEKEKKGEKRPSFLLKRARTSPNLPPKEYSREKFATGKRGERQREEKKRRGGGSLRALFLFPPVGIHGFEGGRKKEIHALFLYLRGRKKERRNRNPLLCPEPIRQHQHGEKILEIANQNPINSNSSSTPIPKLKASSEGEGERKKGATRVRGFAAFRYPFVLASPFH